MNSLHMALVSRKETHLRTENSTFPKTHFLEYIPSREKSGGRWDHQNFGKKLF